MPTIVPPPPTIRPADPGWIPSPLYRMIVEQYEAMVDSGAFKARDRFHLINGYLVAEMTQTPPHVVADELYDGALLRIIPPGWHLLTAKPSRRPSRDSEPEPDRCVVPRTIRDYEGRQPGPDDIALVVEVADSSLPEDRELGAAVYGPSRIPVYWIGNVVDRQVEVYTNPGPEGYRSRVDFPVRQSVAVVIDGQQLGQVAVDDILPSRPARSKTEGNGGLISSAQHRPARQDAPALSWGQAPFSLPGAKSVGAKSVSDQIVHHHGSPRHRSSPS